MSNKVTTSEKAPYTYQDYAQLPEGAPYQLIKGNLVMTPSPTPYHQRIVTGLVIAINQYLEEATHVKGAVFPAPLDVYFEETEVFQPDLLFISKEREHIIVEQLIEGAPDLVVEVISEATAYYNLRHKKSIYAKQGVQEYWIVDPMAQSFEVYELKAG